MLTADSNWMKKLSPRIKFTVDVLRFGLSLVLFWRFPFTAMALDVMVNNLKVYSLIGEPYMVYLELVLQIVSDSKVLPFSFSNPFREWNPETLSWISPTKLQNKGLYGSFLDNYGHNLLGLLSLCVLCFLLQLVCYTILKYRPQSRYATVAQHVQSKYGL